MRPPLDPIEKAIRNALAKGNADDRAFREKVYRSAFAALQKALDANPNVNAEVADHRRRALSARISEIESEFIPAIEPVAAPSPSPTAQRTAPPPAPSPAADTGLALDEDDRALHRSHVHARARTRAEHEAETVLVRSRAATNRRGLRWGVTTAAAAIAVGLGWWIAHDIGVLGGADRQVAATAPSSAQPPATAEPQAPPRASLSQSDVMSGDWIAVFEPTDALDVTAASGATAELRDDDNGPFIRVTAPAGGTVTFSVGPGLMANLSGRRAIFAIVASAEDEQETEFLVECDFSGISDCGRRRYLAGQTRSDFLFETELATGATSAGTISINPDISGQGKALEIRAIRVSTQS
jgi:hypothetical protein